MTDSVIQLKCTCNNYPWGKVGSDSLAARLCSNTPGTDFKIDGQTNYAEMWMGTYPVTPSYVLNTGENLQDVLNANKEQLIGKAVLDKFGADLPFLPKILSIQKALPLQIHPDIELSKYLHKEDPEQFGDTNHKPEIAVALSKFEAFCGFKPKDTIRALLNLDALSRFDPDRGKWTNNTLREVCRSMLVASESVVSSSLNDLGNTTAASLGDQAYILDLIPRLIDQYGAADNGTLVALVLMNYLTFEPGEAIWIPADGIHAYLHGDIVECMARSDNVLNTGFCPRPDRNSVDLFVKALTFEQHDAKKPILERSECQHSSSGKSYMFRPPASEFNMIVTELRSGERDTLKPIKGPSITFVTSGSGKMEAGGKEYDLEPGYIFFICQGVGITYQSSSDDLVVYRACAE